MTTDTPLTLDHLKNWTFAGTPLAVLGYPIHHSISPSMHNAALAEMAKTHPEFSNWQYFRFEVPPDDLPEAIKVLHQNKFRGINLTLPHKIIAFQEIDHIDATAQPIGAINTLSWGPEGYHGFNTDGYGLEHGLGEDLQTTLKEAHVILLGAGGAARGAAIESAQRNCASLWIGNRTKTKADALANEVKALYPSVSIATFDPATPPDSLPQETILINATSAGLKETDPMPINLEKLKSTPKVYDMIYNPAQTQLLRSASAKGFATANGLSMLVHQGVRSLQIWSQKDVPVHTMRKAALTALNLH